MDDELQLDQQDQSPETDTADVDLHEGEDDPLENDEELQQEVLKLYEKCKGEDRYARLVEVKDVKQQEYYWGGRQYIWWSSQDQRWNLPTQQVTSYGDLNVDDMPRYEFVTNIYQARGLMMIGAVAGAPPRVRFFPDDADNEDDLETADARSKMSKLIERWNPVQKSLQEETYHAWTGGFIAWYVRHVKNGEKYGLDSVPTFEQDEEEVESYIRCPNCGWSAPAMEAAPPVPCPQCGTELTDDDISDEDAIPTLKEGEPAQVEKGRVVISVYGALNCCRPQNANEQAKFHYFGIEDEVHYSTLRAAFPDKADQIKPGLNLGSDDVFERNARLSVAENTRLLTQTGAAQKNLCTFVQCWFRPSTFWMIDDKQKRKKLQDIFPRGCLVEFTGTVYCRSKAESMDDAVVTAHAMPGRGQHRPSVGQSLISVNDRLNTFTNIATETYEYGIPITYRASDTFASEADDEQRAAPGLEVEINLPPGQDVRQRIMMTRADSVSPDMYQHMTDLAGPMSDLLTGTYPAATGAGSEQGAPETVGQQAMQRDQAMGRLGIFYVNLKQGHADVMTLACRILEENSTGQLKVPVLGASGDFESESVDVSALEGEAQAYPEGDENFPELWNQQRAIMMQVMDSPFGQQLATDPDNAELFSKLVGIPDLKIPGRDSWRKQLREIGELTKIPDDEGMLTGIAPQVEVDSDDIHPIESKACSWWMNSQKGQRVKRENPVGWMAVKQHKAEHDKAIPPPEPPAKPLSQSLTSSLKDLPIAAQIQILAKEYGLKLTEQDFINSAGLRSAEKQGIQNPIQEVTSGQHP